MTFGHSSHTASVTQPVNDAPHVWDGLADGDPTCRRAVSASTTAPRRRARHGRRRSQDGGDATTPSWPPGPTASPAKPHLVAFSGSLAVALRTTSSLNGARRALQKLRDPAVRLAAEQMLAELATTSPAGESTIHDD